MLTGTNVTAGFYEITAQTATTWTVTGPANLPTAGTTTNATGKMGGALLSPGKACSGMVAGNKVHVKYHASNVYSVTSTTANASQGRISVTAGTSTSVSKLLGYELVHEDFTGNRPTIQAAVNTMTVLTQAGTRTLCSNLIIDQGSATGIVGVATAGGSVCFFVRVDGANATAAFNCASDSHLIGCEALNSSGVEGFRSNGATFYNCLAKDGTDDGWDCAAGVSTMVRCYSVGNTGGSTDGVAITGATARLLMAECVVYGNGDHGISNAGPSLGTVCINTISYGNADIGLIANNGGLIIKCASGGNGTDFGSVAMTQIDSITLTTDPFTDSAGDDFSLNNTSGGGALLREEGYPEISLPAIDTLSFHSIGAAEYEHAGEQADTPNPSVHMLLALPTSPSIDQIGLLLAGLTSS